MELILVLNVEFIPMLGVIGLFYFNSHSIHELHLQITRIDIRTIYRSVTTELRKTQFFCFPYILIITQCGLHSIFVYVMNLHIEKDLNSSLTLT